MTEDILNKQDIQRNNKMTDYRFGKLAISKAGHDKSKVYVIMSEEDEYVYLVDGKIRTISNPKKKKKKHIQIIHSVDHDLMAEKENGTLTNEKIKRVIKMFLKKSSGIR